MSLDVYEDIERCMAGGWSDGLPVIPPYGSLVEDMLAAMGWGYAEVVGSLPEQSIEVHASHVAAAAVMAGCRFEYGPRWWSPVTTSGILVPPTSSWALTGCNAPARSTARSWWHRARPTRSDSG